MLMAEDTERIHSFIREKSIALGPKENFGLPTPVPGVGYSWKRSVQDEPLYTQRDKVFKSLERYDGYK